jgi:ribosomal protein L11 methyltransferase
MGYYEFIIKIPFESKEALIEHLYNAGCLGVVDNDNTIVTYFSDIIGIDKVINFIQSAKKVIKDSGLNDDFSFEYVYIGERDWNESWKKRFKPIDIGKAITILPPWENKKTGRINLIIDPGMAFGTGHHETTKTCLMLIEKYSKEITKKDRFLDFGTGTAILAIAALKLGFKYALCVDIDPFAIDSAKRNAELNNLKNIKIKEGSISAVKGKFDFIAANLMSEILIQNAHEIAVRLNKSGIALLSGMIVGQEKDVISAIQREGLYVSEIFCDGRWITIKAVKSNE